MKENTYEMACSKGYDIVTITRGMNGYPEGLYSAVSGFGCFPEAEDFAKEIGGEIVLLCKRDGHQFWSNCGRTFSPIQPDQEWFDDDEELIQVDGAGDWWRNEWEKIKDMAWEDPIDLGCHIQRIESIYNLIEGLDFNEQLKIDGRYRAEIIPIESMHYHDNDVTDYMVAVIDKEW